MNVVIDALLSYARYHLGRFLVYVERIPQYGPLLAAMDAEAVIWAKQATISIDRKQQQQQQVNSSAKSGSTNNNNNNPQSLKPKNNSITGGGGGGGGNVSSSSTSSSSSSSISSTFSLSDITATRRIIIYLESLLLAVPLKDRHENNNNNNHNHINNNHNQHGDWARRYTGNIQNQHIQSKINILHMTVYNHWIERKSRCDALLSLCNVIVQAALKNQQQQQQQK
jgi:hypothetical protein